MKKKTVAIGLLGTTLDLAPRRGDRWSAWRPSVAICQHEDFVLDRFELLFEKKSASLVEQVRADIASASPETEVNTHSIQLDNPWDFQEVYRELYSFARNYAFDTDSEEYLAHITTGTHVAQICLFLLTESRHIPGRLLQASPPRRSSQPSRGSLQFIDLDLSKYDQLATRFQQEREDSVTLLKRGIATRNEAFNDLIDSIERVSLATKAPILLTGPTGAGKSQLAASIYQLKRSRQKLSGALVEVNCATLRGEGAMSTLFGHIKGAFTGAVSARKGLLKAADGGVLFLDEVGELGLDEQAMLLRAIEEKVFQPVGSDSTTSSNFQLIAGTNRDLAQRVAEGRFRDDLLARINLWTFRLPGLAERREDISPNVEYELDRFSEANGRRVTINREALARFLNFACSEKAPWSANFRDLNAAVTRMATLAPSGRITLEVVADEVTRLQALWRMASTEQGDRQKEDEALLRDLLHDRLKEVDRFDQVQLADVVRVCQQSKSLSAAGRTLFAHSRTAKQKPNDSDRLRKYLARFGLDWQTVRGS
ncbi:MAG: RNA repair transcriptional activator RtcR [Aureliella sp.]